MIRLSSKISLCGDDSVGKTSLRKRYIGQNFNANYLETLGADFTTKIVVFNNKSEKFTLKLLIWDIAGQESFQGIRAKYFEGSQAIILIFDLTNRKSFDNIINWMNEIKKSIKLPPIILLGNKIDLIKNKTVILQVKKEETQNLVRKLTELYYKDAYTVPYLETSAKTGENVEQAFNIISDYITSNYLEEKDKKKIDKLN